ncbi:MAG: acylphosphatase [Atopobiaceae bacterium]|jgi:acylphosphatase
MKWPWARKPTDGKAHVNATGTGAPDIPFGTVRYRLVYVGKVQAVGFRFTAQTIAQSAGCTGWVKNMSDGSVLVEVQGRPEQVARFEQGIMDASHDPNTWIEARLQERKSLDPKPERTFRTLM